MPTSATEFHTELLPALRYHLGTLIDTDDMFALPVELLSESTSYELRVEFDASRRAIIERTRARLAESLTGSVVAHARYRGIRGRFTVTVGISNSAAASPFVANVRVLGDDRPGTDARATRMHPAASHARRTTSPSPAHRATRAFTRDTEPATRSSTFDPNRYRLVAIVSGTQERINFDTPVITVGRLDDSGDGTSQARFALNAPYTVSRLQLELRCRDDESTPFEVVNLGRNTVFVGERELAGTGAPVSRGAQAAELSRMTMSAATTIVLANDVLLRIEDRKAQTGDVGRDAV